MYKIYIGIVFFSAFVMSCVLLQNFVKNIVALLKASKDDVLFIFVNDGALMKGWKIYVTAFMWALFIVLNLFNS